METAIIMQHTGQAFSTTSSIFSSGQNISNRRETNLTLHNHFRRTAPDQSAINGNNEGKTPLLQVSIFCTATSNNQQYCDRSNRCHDSRSTNEASWTIDSHLLHKPLCCRACSPPLYGPLNLKRRPPHALKLLPTRCCTCHRLNASRRYSVDLGLPPEVEVSSTPPLKTPS